MTTNLGDAPVVPDVTLVGVAVVDEPDGSLLDVLLDRIHLVPGGNFHLLVGPSGHFNHHVEGVLWKILTNHIAV